MLATVRDALFSLSAGVQMRLFALAAHAMVLTLGQAVAPAGAQQPAPLTTVPTSKAERFRQGIAELHRKYGVPGFVVTVFSTRGLEAAEAIGVKRVGQPARLELSDRFYIASNAKPLTATLAGTMVDAGRIAWTTTPAEVWPSHARRMDPRLRRVTLAQLLSNKGGIQPFTSDTEIAAAPHFVGTPRQQREAFAKWILAGSPASEIGKFRYSNAGFGLAAAMIEKVADQSWEELLRERVFQPLAMSSCGFGWPSTTGDQPRGHRLAGNTYAEQPETSRAGLPAWLAPAGDVHCSVPDLARFGEARMLGMLDRHSLLRPETYRAAHGPAGEYVLGWNNEIFGLTHRGGHTAGWHSFLVVSPSNRIAVAVSTNAREPGRTDEMMTEVLQLAFDLFSSR
jgi:D-alanyl-D-alanine carboxypeptidase